MKKYQNSDLIIYYLILKFSIKKNNYVFYFLLLPILFINAKITFGQNIIHNNRIIYQSSKLQRQISEIVEPHRKLNQQIYSKIIGQVENRFSKSIKLDNLQDNLSSGNSDSLIGSVAVGVFFVDVDSSNNIMSNWNKQLEDSLLINMYTASQFWVDHAANYSKKVSFKLIPYFSDSVKASFNQGNISDWVDQVMTKFGFTNSYPENVTAFNSWLRTINNNDCSFSVFVFNYNATPTDGALAYAAEGGPRIIMRNAPNEQQFQENYTHEIGHIFWALDEYYMPDYGGAGDTLNFNQSPRSYISNGNADQTNQSAINTVDCIMKNQFSTDICAYTAAHVGWIDHVERTLITSTPIGLLFDAYKTSGIRYQTPETFPWGRGTSINISTPTSQVEDSSNYIFSNWSDNGQQSHIIHIMDSDPNILNSNFVRNGTAMAMWYYLKPKDWWSRQVNHIAIEKNGNVWITTGESILKFDGKKLATFDLNNSPIPSGYGVGGVAIDKNNVKWFGTAGGVVSYDDSTWKLYKPSNSGLGSSNITGIIVDQLNNKWFCSYDNGVTKFDGVNWTIYNTSNSQILSNYISSAAVDSNNNIWIGSWTGISEFDGNKWNNFESKNIPVLSNIFSVAVMNDSIILAGSNSGIVEFKNNSWTSLPYNLTGQIESIAIDTSGNIYCGGGRGFSVISNDNLSTYSIDNSMFYGGFFVGDIKIDSHGNKWIATFNGLYIYNEKLTTPVSVSKEKFNILNSYFLSQNYPNPFNPSTIISYSVPKSSIVTIKVFDILGREVSTLVNEMKLPGNYKETFNAGKLASGVYFYQLKANGYTLIKKMLLLK